MDGTSRRSDGPSESPPNQNASPGTGFSTLVERAETFVARFQAGPGRSALDENLQPHHITQYLESQEREHARSHFTERLIVVAIVAGVLLICLMFLAFQQVAPLEKVITLLVGFGGGFGAGWGIRSRKGNE